LPDRKSPKRCERRSSVQLLACQEFFNAAQRAQRGARFIGNEHLIASARLELAKLFQVISCDQELGSELRTTDGSCDFLDGLFLSQGHLADRLGFTRGVPNLSFLIAIRVIDLLLALAL